MSDGVVGIKQDAAPDRLVDNEVLTIAAQTVYRQRVKSFDTFSGGDVLADVAGDGTVKTLTFASAVDMLWIRCDGGNGRADPFGGTPSASVGIFCDDGIPNPITVTVTSVKVFAANGVTIRAYGLRY